jgi:hypothetical protein
MSDQSALSVQTRNSLKGVDIAGLHVTSIPMPRCNENSWSKNRVQVGIYANLHESPG